MRIYLDEILNDADKNAIIRQLEAARGDCHLVALYITGGGTTNVTLNEAMQTIRNLKRG